MEVQNPVDGKHILIGDNTGTKLNSVLNAIYNRLGYKLIDEIVRMMNAHSV